MQVHGAESRFQNPTDGPSSPFFERNSRQETCPRSRTHIPHGPSTRLLGCSERSRKRRKKSRREEKRVVAILRLEPAFFTRAHSSNSKPNHRASGYQQSTNEFLLPTGRPPATPASRHSHQNPSPPSPELAIFADARAFRNNVMDCIERNWRHTGRRAQHTGMGWAASRRLPPSPSQRPRSADAN